MISNFNNNIDCYRCNEKPKVTRQFEGMQGWYVKSNRQLITVSVSVSFSLLDWTQCVWFILIVSKLFNSGQQEFDISKDFHLCAFMTQYKAYGIIQSMYIRINSIQYNTYVKHESTYGCLYSVNWSMYM